MLTSASKRQAFKVIAAAAVPALVAVLLAGRPGHAEGQPPPGAVAAPTTRLFADSTIVVSPRISVEIVGKGPDVVLIPGLASSRETYKRTAERLRGKYRLHLVQVAGFAGEPARANATGPFFEPVADALAAYITHLGRPIVVGHSLGGTLALALAERGTVPTARVLIVDSLPFYGVLMGGPTATAETVRPMVEGMRSRPVTRMSEPQARAMMGQMITAPADVDRVVAWSMDSDPAVVMTAMTDDMLADLRPNLAKVTMPITILYEKPLEPMIASGYAALGPKTLVAAAPGAKHFIMYDDPKTFDATLDAFLAK